MAYQPTLRRVIDAQAKSASSGPEISAVGPSRPVSSQHQSSDVQAVIRALELIVGLQRVGDIKRGESSQP